MKLPVNRPALPVFVIALLYALSGCASAPEKTSASTRSEEVIGGSLPSPQPTGPSAPATAGSGARGGGAAASRAARGASAAPTGGAYSPEQLREAFVGICQRLGYRVLALDVDQSDQPYLVYGAIEGRADYKALRDELNATPGYAYSGSVTAEDTRNGRTLFVFNMVPNAAKDRAAFQKVSERMKQLLPLTR